MGSAVGAGDCTLAGFLSAITKPKTTLYLQPNAPKRVYTSNGSQQSSCGGNMPKNKLIYYGILIIAATALLWLGYYIMQAAFYALPATAAIGIVMVILGMVMEAKKAKQPEGDKPEDPNV
jgi:hypothetical protein